MKGIATAAAATCPQVVGAVAVEFVFFRHARSGGQRRCSNLQRCIGAWVPWREEGMDEAGVGRRGRERLHMHATCACRCIQLAISE